MHENEENWTGGTPKFYYVDPAQAWKQILKWL